MAASVLEMLKASNFASVEDGDNVTEGKFGIPRYNGDPTRYQEYVFRVRARIRKEKKIDEKEVAKLGPLGLRLLEGLTGTAFRAAQMLDIEKLESAEGPEILLQELATTLQPKREQQARELYEAGAMVGGMMSRQHGEGMAQFVMRRRAWYRALLDSSSDMKLPEVVLAEQLLQNARITDDQRLMVRTALQGKLTFDSVAQELVNQHPRLHERERFPYKGKKGFGKHHGRPKGYFHASHAYWTEQNDQDYFYDDEYAMGYLAEEYAEDGYVEENYMADYEEPDELDFQADALAYMAEQGLSLEDYDSAEYAAEMIQIDAEGYFAGKGGKAKGLPRLRDHRFELSGHLRLEEKRQRLQELKNRTTCRRCGATGHWSSDSVCPKNRGKSKSKGKFTGSAPTAPSSSSTSTTTTTPKGSGRNKGSGKRPVYFAIAEDVQPEPAAMLALRREPGRDNQPVGQLPLQHHGHGGQAASQGWLLGPPPVPHRHHAEQGHGHGEATSQPSTSQWSIVQAEQRPLWLDGSPVGGDGDADVEMDRLLREHEREHGRQARDESSRVQEPPMPQTSPSTSAAPQPSVAPTTARPSCAHTETTSVGSNQYQHVVRCKRCGLVLSRTKKDVGQGETATTTTAAATQPRCSHHKHFVAWIQWEPLEKHLSGLRTPRIRRSRDTSWT